jgi:hypothetical protein
MTIGTSLGYAYGYTHITSNATTNIKTGNGILNSIVVNNPGATWTITVNDGASVIAVIAAAAAQSTMLYECAFNTSLSVVTSGTTPGDITVTWS